MHNVQFVTMEITKMKIWLYFVEIAMCQFIKVAMVLSNYLRVIGFVTIARYLEWKEGWW